MRKPSPLPVLCSSLLGTLTFILLIYGQLIHSTPNAAPKLVEEKFLLPMPHIFLRHIDILEERWDK